ncbi:MAG: PVC-type heme-binding CxxCH protein [Gemmataceae bacterium]
MPTLPFRLAVALAVSSLAVAAVIPAEPAANEFVANASGEAQKALKRFRTPGGVEGKVWAAEPLLANPVSFAFDEKGRCYVAETFRLHQGATDNRNHMDWLNDDIACRTVADRVAMYRKFAKDKFASTYEAHTDRIRLIEDTTGSGVADKATVFADGFGHAADGIGAGLLARKGVVWYTCIPDLWRFENGKRESLATGFGVHVAFLGHDLHGLRMGPDGRIYFSSGDRGLNVTTREGKHLFVPDCGAVCRCEPDGSNLEVVATGLRNPQELAFDEYGNLFTMDNNSDSGDEVRLVNIVEGGDSGWRMSYQYGTSMGNRGPFNAEKIWNVPIPPEQPAYIVPPLANFTSGPSGLCYNPGCVALPEKYAGHFFVCDFRGSSGGSGVVAFQVKPKGAAFELARKEEFIWSILATDCDFGPDGGFYISDWTEGWNLTGKGRIYRFADPVAAKKPEVAEVKKLLAEGFDQRSIEELAKLLHHPDQRIRQEAQFALADKGEAAIPTITELAQQQAKNPSERLVRIHAIWALGQIGRKHKKCAEPLRQLMRDHDSEVRAQSVKTLADLRIFDDLAILKPLLGDTEPRVRMFAALAIPKIALEADALRVEQSKTVSDLLEPVIEMIQENADGDLYVRHAGVMALSVLLLDNPYRIETLEQSGPSVRMATVLALRRLKWSSLIGGFLDAKEPAIALEAARAINDLPIPDALPQLAAMLAKPGLHEHFLYRALNANFRLGKPANAAAVAAFAARADAPEKLRVEAVKMLGDWATPSNRDRITGLYQPLSPRDPQIAAEALRAKLGGIFAGSEALRKESARVGAKLGVKEVAVTLRDMIADGGQSAAGRVEALRSLEALKDAKLDEVATGALSGDQPLLRAEARRVLAQLHPEKAVAMLREALVNGSVFEKQSALSVLADLKRDDSDIVLLNLWDKLHANRVPAELQLDLIEAVSRRKNGTGKYAQAFGKIEPERQAGDHLAGWRESLVGGDAAKGRDIFLNKSEVSCVRCHKLNGTGGDVGPELAGIGGKQNREYLLESIVLPDKQIAKGFDSVVLELTNGKTVTGVLKSEDDKEVKLMTAEGHAIVVPKAQIEERRRGKSAMPEDLVQKLTRREIRDLVEFLAGLK